jgi:hypothetical protein
MQTVIIDNFLPYPNVVRSWALQHEFLNSTEYSIKTNKHTHWPGLRSASVIDLDHMYGNTIYTIFANLITRTYNQPNIGLKSYFQLTRECDGHSWVHQDNNIAYAGILYLNPNVDPKYGTTLYKCNNVSKWESYMTTSEGYNILTTINAKENVKLYNELFTPVDYVGNVFNRLVIYNGETYHKSTEYFGTDKHDSRLTQVFFATIEE